MERLFLCSCLNKNESIRGKTTLRDEIIAYCVELPRLESSIFRILRDPVLIIRPRIDFSVIFIIYKLEQLFGCVFTEREIKICPLGGAGGIFFKE